MPNAVHHVRVHETTRTRLRITNVETDRRMVRISMANPHKLAIDIWKEIFVENPIELSVRSVCNRFNEA